MSFEAPELLTVREAADALKVHRSTIYELLERKAIRGIRLGSYPGAAIRIRAADISKILEGAYA